MTSTTAALQAKNAPIAGLVAAQTIRFLRLPAVCERTGLSRSQIYRMESAGQFPARVKLSEICSAWVESEVEIWAAGRIVASRGAAQG
jgi:predicted DNA-binding transcriptional regulator AlpA